MIKMCNEMMGSMGMDGMMQKGMGMMGGKGDDTPEEATSGDVSETVQTETEVSAKKN